MGTGRGRCVDRLSVPVLEEIPAQDLLLPHHRDRAAQPVGQHPAGIWILMAVTPTFRSNNFLSGSQTGSFTIAEPAGTAPGDIIIALIVNSTATGFLTPVDV